MLLRVVLYQLYCQYCNDNTVLCPRAGVVRDAGTVVHAQVQTAALGADGAQPTGGAGRHGAAVGAVPADDGQRVPVGPDAQRPAQRPGDGGADEAHTQPQAPEVDVPAADQGRARVHGLAADQAEPAAGRRRGPVVRHQAAVVVVQGRNRVVRTAPRWSRPQLRRRRRRRRQPVVRVRLAQAFVAGLFGRR